MASSSYIAPSTNRFAFATDPATVPNAVRDILPIGNSIRPFVTDLWSVPSESEPRSEASYRRPLRLLPAVRF